ncbi:MAG: oxaloacetate-decarboxylating malate dehydrogenase [Burkholderiaceae bacterium]|nr:oxaloacetate-decarboxylating malate dehydrogenase [Burkholderiaceae bacterium]
MNNKKGFYALKDPYVNRGTSFTAEDRENLQVLGLIPPTLSSLEVQAKRVMNRLNRQDDALEKYVILHRLSQRNQTLFCYLLTKHFSELIPIIYTPTVARACIEFSHLFLEEGGVYISIDDLGKVEKIINNVPNDDVAVIVVTDGETVLGLGDFGIGGLCVARSKVSLNCACGGIKPSRALPVIIDVGTNNPTLSQDPFYVGLSHVRIGGEGYKQLISEFIRVARQRWPHALIQFEGFSRQNAFYLLNQWEQKIPCFNNDIQGTASVVLSGLYSACKIKGSQLKDEKILFFGSGQVAIGIANLLMVALCKEGLTTEEASQRIYLFDSKGLVTVDRDDLQEIKRPFAHVDDAETTLLDAIELIRPSVIVGTAAQAGAFNAYVLGAMARINARPIIFSLSNPSSKTECSARDAYIYTAGSCLYAGGSPFAPIEHNGKHWIPSQSNNLYVFPGIVLGTTFCQAKEIPQELFLVAARALHSMVTEEELSHLNFYPSLNHLREISLTIATAVAQYCYEEGIAGNERPVDLCSALESSMYVPK